MSEQIGCMKCGKCVSSPVPNGTVVRAYVKCPECIEQAARQVEDKIATLRDRVIETIRALHGIRDSDRTFSGSIVEATAWRLYQQSPEMKDISRLFAELESIA